MVATVLPARTIVTLPYAANYEDTGSSGSGLATAIRAISLNGCFDPEVTGAGHQPMGFDQWSTFYTKYQVLSCNFKIYAINLGIASTNVQYIYWFVDAEGSDRFHSHSFSDLKEQPQIRMKLLPPSFGGNMRSVTVRDTINVSKTLRKVYNVQKDNIPTLTTANPAKQLYLHIGFVNQYPTGVSAPNILYNIKLRYKTMMIDWKELAQS